MKNGIKAFFAAYAIVSACPASAGIVVNGSFEQDTLPVGTFGQQVMALSGWTVGNGPLTLYKNGFNLQQIALSAHNGNFALNLADGSVRMVNVSQTISTLPFQEYQVSYWVGNYSANGGPAVITPSIVDGTSNTIVFAEGSAPATNQPSTWERFAFDFISDGTSNTIMFTETIDPFYTGAVGPTYTGLDDVSVIAVPEPSAWALALLGFAGLGVAGFRRARSLAPA